MSFVDDLVKVVHADGRILIGGSFRGVAFFIEDTSTAGGRRVSSKQAIDVDVPVVRDLGRKSKAFSVTAYVIGENVRALARDLEAALDARGPGELIHPYRGRLRVSVDGYTVSTRVTEGRIVTFQMNFLEAPDLGESPVIITDDFSALVAAAAASAVATSAELESTIDVSEAPSYALISLSDELTLRSSAVGDALSALQLTSQELAAIEFLVQEVTSNAVTLVRSPPSALAAFLAILDSLADTLSDSPREVANALMEAYEVTAIADVIGDTDSREQERVNQAALRGALRQSILYKAAEAMGAVDFESVEQASADAAAITALIDQELELAGDTVYPALIELRTRINEAIPGDDVIAREITISYPVELPSIIIAYKLYGDPERAAEIEARNDVSHPGFISGDIRVLSDG